MADNTAAVAGQVTGAAKKLPPWVWIAIIGGGLVIGLILRARKTAAVVAGGTANQPDPTQSVSGDGTLNPGQDPYASAQPQNDGQVYSYDPSTRMYSNVGPSGSPSTLFTTPLTGGGPPNTAGFAHASDIAKLRKELKKQHMKDDKKIRKLEKQLKKSRHQQHSGIDSTDNPNIPDAAQ